MPFGLGGPNPVSKALERCRRLHVRRRKPAFGGINLLDLPLIPPFCRSVRPTPTFKSFFTLKTMFLLLLRPSKIFIFFNSAQSAEWCLGGKRSPRRQRVRLSLLLYFCNSLGRCLADFTHLSAHSPQQRRRRVRKKQSMIDRPTLYVFPTLLLILKVQALGFYHSRVQNNA
jgi:hypothetical protein